MVSNLSLLSTQFCFYFVNVRNFGCIEMHALLFNLALEGSQFDGRDHVFCEQAGDVD